MEQAFYNKGFWRVTCAKLHWNLMT